GTVTRIRRSCQHERAIARSISSAKAVSTRWGRTVESASSVRLAESAFFVRKIRFFSLFPLAHGKQLDRERARSRFNGLCVTRVRCDGAIDLRFAAEMTHERDREQKCSGCGG